MENYLNITPPYGNLKGKVVEFRGMKDDNDPILNIIITDFNRQQYSFSTSVINPSAAEATPVEKTVIFDKHTFTINTNGTVHMDGILAVDFNGHFNGRGTPDGGLDYTFTLGRH